MFEALGRPWSVREFIALAVMCLAATVPFWGKAFHIDDVLYLEQARQILREPWDPYGAETWWRGKQETLFEANFNPPFFHYLMAGVVWITGESELALHGLESIFVASAAIGLYLLSRRFTRHALPATAMIMLGPAMLPGQNVMLEGPLMAFWLWAVWCQLRACDTGQVRWAVVAGLVAALGVWTKYTAGLLLPLLALLSLLRRRPATLCCLVPPFVLLALWSLHNQFFYGRSHLQSLAWPGQFDVVLTRVPGVIVGLGSLSLISLLVVVSLGSRLTHLGLVLFAAFVQAALCVWANDALSDNRPPAYLAHCFAFAFNGGVILFGSLVLVLHAWARGRDAQVKGITRTEAEGMFLVAWAMVFLVYNCVSVPFLAVRHLLPGLPPFVWGTLRMFEQSPIAPPLKRLTLATSVVATLVVGFCLAVADFAYARLPRQLLDDSHGADSLTPLDQTSSRRWFVGQWGRSYYAERAGMRCFRPEDGDQLRPGDIVFLFDRGCRGDQSAFFGENAESLFQSSPRPPVPLCTIAPGVNYYAYQTDDYPGLPWRFSMSPMEHVQVLRINAKPLKLASNAQQPPRSDVD